MKRLIILMSLLSVVVLGAYSSDKKEKKEKVEIDGFALVENKQFVFEAQSMTSQNGVHRSLTTLYDLTMNGDSASAYLPYVGRAYGGAYGGDGAIEFDGPMQDYKIELREKKKEKNNQMMISFIVKGEKDTYTCNLTVSRSGNSSLNVNSNNRQPISFNGQIYEIKED